MIYTLSRCFFLSGGVANFLAGCANKFRTYNGPEITRLRLYKSEWVLMFGGAQGVIMTYPVGFDFAPVGHKRFERKGAPSTFRRITYEALKQHRHILQRHGLGLFNGESGEPR